MSITSSLSHLVPKKNKGYTPEEEAFQRLFFEAHALIADKKLLKPLEKDYNILMHTPGAPRSQAQMLKLYFSVEDCIVLHEPPLVRQLYTKPVLRRDLAKVVDAQKLPSVFAIILSPSPLDLTLAFQQILETVSRYVVGRVGTSILQTYISELTAGTLLERTMTWQQSLPFFKVDKATMSALAASQVSWEVSVKKLFDGLYTKLVYSGGEAFANVPFETWYTGFKALYANDDIMSHVVAVLPTQITKTDKVQYLTRRELVTRLGELTSQIADLKEQTTIKVKDESKKLQAELAQLKEYINGVRSGILVLDAFGNAILMNSSFELFYEKGKIASGQYSVEQFVATHTLFKAGTNTPYPEDSFALLRALRGVASINEDLEIVLGGAHKHTRITANPHMDQDKVQYVVATFEDITQETSTIRAKEYLLAAVLEELKNPVAEIVTTASELPTQKDPGQAAHHIQQIGTRLNQALSQFQQVAAIELGSLPLKREVFDIIAHVKRTTSAYESRARTKGLSLRIQNETAMSLSTIADKRRVKEVLAQLLDNALEHTDHGSVVVQIDNDPHMVKIRVHDTGRGIAETAEKNLFTMFQKIEKEQVATPDISARTHTGLGLYICKILVTSMGGSIGLERAAVGQGSVFYFTLPIAKYM